MKRIPRFIGAALGLYLLCGSTTAQTQRPSTDSCSQANLTQADMNQCAGKDLQQAEIRLGALLKRLGIDQNSPEQKAWEAYRDAQLKAIYPPRDNEMAEYGSVYPMCWATLKKKLTEGRIRDLKGLTTAEGDVCHGYRVGGSGK